MNAHLRAPISQACPGGISQIDKSIPITARRGRASRLGLLMAIGVAVAAMIACSSGPQQPTGPAGVYAKAKANFAKSGTAGTDRDLDDLANLANADPANEYTTRARVLRLVILSGQVQGYRMLSDAYGKGAQAAKPAAIKAQYAALQRDVDRRGAELTLRLGEVVMQLTKGGSVPKDLVLDAPYPNLEVPPTIQTLENARTGLETGREEQAQAEMLAVRTAVLDALAAMLHVDRVKAQSEMSAGPVEIDPTQFRLFVADQIMAGAVFYEPKHLFDPEHYKLLAGVAQDSLAPVQAALKQSPDPDCAKRMKKLQDQIKSGLKGFPNLT
jgi:hypothetical protein